MNKLWKIGTNIEHYIDEIFEFSKKYGDTFFVYHKKNDNTVFCLDFHRGNIIEKKRATASQFIRVLLALKIIECDEFASFQKEIEMLYKKNYRVCIHSKDELKECIVNNLINTTIKIYEDKVTSFTSEKNFIFSLLATLFSIDNIQNKRRIERQISKHTINDIIPNYKSIALLIQSSINYESLLNNEKIHKYIIGITSGIKKIMNTISSYSCEYNKLIYSSINLKYQLESKVHTFGNFLKTYILENSKLEIPIYQRKYIWTKELVNILLQDIMNIKENMTHYIGNITFKGKNEGLDGMKYKIIDGQQRITTLILIAKVIFDYGKFKGKEWYICKKINEAFTFQKSTNSCPAVESFIRIEGNDDYAMFRSIAMSKLDEKSIKTMNSQIYNNYLEILDWFDVNMNTSKIFEYFQNNFLNCLTTVVINAKGSDEFTIFEKLNTSSIPLTTLELFKNYAIDKFPYDTDEKELQALFENSIESHFYKNTNKNATIESFMITYIRTNKSNWNSNDTTFNQFKELIEAKYVYNDIGINIKTLLEEIGKEIELYMTISKYEKYTDPNSYAYKYSDFLYMLNGRSVYYPIIIKLIKLKFDDYQNPKYEEICEFRKFMRILEIYEVRLQIGAQRGQSLSKTMEKILSKINKNTTPYEFWEIVKGKPGSSNEISSIDTMVQAFKMQPINNKSANIIMTRIENYFHLTNNWDVDKHDVNFQAMYEKPSNREHLLPQKWEEHWTEDLMKWLDISSIETIEENIYKYINFIGNAFPIPEWSNKGIKNLSLKEKINNIKNKIYSKKLLLLNGIDGRLDAIGDSFTYEDIKKRSEQIAEIAREIWADFPSN